MARGQGRDQREPMERLVRLASALHHAGRDGVSGERLIRIAGFEGEDAGSQLNREFRHLRNQGWQIDNVAGKGLAAHYVMTAVDNRLRLKLTPGQQAALRRAVLLADRDDLVERLGLAADARPPEVSASVPLDGRGAELDTAVRAVRLGCRLRFRYKGSERVVHPESVRTQNGKWYVRGREDGGDVVKSFVVSRMSEVRADAPGTAVRTQAERHGGLHPMTWEIDPPVEVTLAAPEEFAPDVRRWLGATARESVRGGEVEFVYTVTNRSALRSRLYELGSRVRIVGPESVRTEVLAELSEMAGE